MHDGQIPLVLLLVGLPASGKSTYAQRRGWPVLSSDDLRLLLADDARQQSVNGLVFPLMRRLLRARLRLGRPITCVDATNLTPRERRPYLRIAADLAAAAEAVYFDVPLAVCQERNAARERVVPADAMLLLSDRLRPPTLGEGFRAIWCVR